MPIRSLLRPASTNPSLVIASPGLVIASAARQSTALASARAASALALLWLALAALTVLSGPARAAEVDACASPQAQAGDPPATTLQRMLAAVPVCQKDANFLAALGQLLNSQGRYLEAADHLERALMLDPALKDAQLSYAIALTGSGDVLSAAALLDNLLADPALPAHLRPLIAQQKATLAGVAAVAGSSGWQSRFTLATRVGYDSNLLGSPNLSSLALTLSGQTLVLPLDQSFLARGGRYARADAQLDLHRTAPDGARWNAVADLRSRYSPKVQEAGSTQIDLLLERSHITPSSAGSYFNVNASELDAQAGTHYLASGVAGGWGRAWPSAGAAGCQTRLGAEWQSRQYLDNPVLSGRYTGLSAFWSCEQPSGMQWLLGLKAGQDAAQDAARPGGDQRQSSLRVAAFLPLANLVSATAPALSGLRRGGVLLDLQQSQQTDSRGYSSIIDSGRTRTISRRAARLEYQYPISPAAQWVLGAEWVAQASSLELFRLDSRGGYTGLRVSW